jgi:DNA-binding transcriptional MerR regulator
METHYSLTELSQLVEISPRTIRFYMSKGLVDKPLGARKTAYYTDTHLQQLLTVINWQKEGLSLDEIFQQQNQLTQKSPPQFKPGDVQVVHRIHIAEGVELNVDLLKTQLSQTQIRQLSDQVYGWLVEKSEQEKAGV